MPEKTVFTSKGLENITQKFASRKTSNKLPHFYDSLGNDRSSVDPITGNLIQIIEEFREEFNKMYDEVEMVKAFVVDTAFGQLDSDVVKAQIGEASALAIRFENGSLYFTIDGTEREVQLIKFVAPS